ncbi:ras and Rab interactor 3 isoform X3 [Betta splendens]|uniref:Ras and Rab interactor 3 isoform X3 n=1 Tax=Betta splendens TaxID=158456 RepID=A0A6P7LIT1_BETSP|nr:ras and Rab interactor 3 isoform X3 [Betta splendens]
MELRETEWAIEQPIFGNIMEATVDSQDISHTSPVSGILSTPSIHSSSPLSPPSLSSHPPSRPCRPKHPPKTSYLPSRPPLPTSAPLLLSPPVSKPPAHIPTKSAPLLVSPPLPSNPPSLALPTTLSPTMVSISPLLSLQASVSHDLSPTSTPAALPLSLSSTASFASSSLLPPPLPVMPPFSSSPPLLSPIDCLLGTTSVWQPKGLSLHQINIILEKENAGVFVVHTEDYSMTVSVRLPDEHKAPLVHSVMVKQHKTFVHLDGSSLVFDDIFKLISFYCVSRDILAVTLMLPLAIATATKREELETISAMGADFWTSDLNQKVKKQDQDLDQCYNTSYWYINPVPVEMCSDIDPNMSSTCTHGVTNQKSTSSPQNGETPQTVAPEVKGQIQNKPDKEMKYKRPPPRPPSLGSSSGTTLLFLAPSLNQPSSSITKATEKKEDEKGVGAKENRKVMLTSPSSRPPVFLQSRTAPPLPPAPLCCTSRRKSTVTEVGEDTGREKEQNPAKKTQKLGGGEKGEAKTGNKASHGELVEQDNSHQQQEEEEGKADRKKKGEKKEEKVAIKKEEEQISAKQSRPVPPPRKRPPETPVCPSQNKGLAKSPPSSSQMGWPDVSLYSPQGGAAIGTDADSCSTSSTEEEAESLQEQEQNHNRPTESHKAAMKRTSTTVMLDRARYRLSTVLTGLISHDRRLTQRIVEMARAPTSYIGNLVKEHRAFTLETMSNHLTSTELLQEIRQMMTQLRSYLLQSAELQALLEPQHQYSQDKIENIVEAAMCKSVLKPLREPIYQSLEKLHTANGSLKQLAQNQSVVLGSTTTALGITTAVPEASAMEKISIKLNNLHLEYSPQKKIELLLKACKIIYDAMSVSCPARSNLSALQLDVEYMMELMDPSLTLGEGSYYLTTTYGALEHIKTFDQQRSATRQLSREVQDSIHRWERRRTLNKESMSQGSVRDFLTVCCPDIEANPKTLGVLPNTTIQQLSEQCTTRFEQSEESYTLSVYIDGLHQPLAPTELALSVKNSCQPGTYCFVYHPIGQSNNKPSRTCPSDPPPAPPAENLITANTRPVAPEAEEEILIEL